MVLWIHFVEGPLIGGQASVCVCVCVHVCAYMYMFAWCTPMSSEHLTFTTQRGGKRRFSLLVFIVIEQGLLVLTSMAGIKDCF